VQLEETRRRLGACIPKSQPFIEVWRKARLIQEESNRAAARFDKASSQYTAAKEMIRVTEGELANVITQSSSSSDAGSGDTSSLNHALLEVLNHATTKVMETEREKRESEAEHRRVLDRCTAVLEEYRTIERRLRPHIVKSRPYYEQRWNSSQRLGEIKSRINSLEEQLKSTKRRYAATMHHLDQLNYSLHRQRRANSLSPFSTLPLPQSHHQTASERSSPDLAPGVVTDRSDSESVQSWQLLGEGVPFTGSTGSLPSVGSSVSEESEDGTHTLAPGHLQLSGVTSQAPVIRIVDEDSVSGLAQSLVHHALQSAVSRLRQQY
jgi:hypothetical protein